MIRRLAFLALTALFLCGQSPIAGFPPGTFSNRAALDGGTAAYTGPIDINGTAYAFWSTRCGAAAYSGNILDVWDSATGSTTETVLGCDGAGGIVVKSGSALATTCGSGCRIKTIYDQSGANNCTGACDLTQATNANRPTFSATAKAGMGFSGTQCVAAIAAATAQGQPFTVSAVYDPTGLSGTGDFLSDSSAGFEASHLGGSAKQSIYAGGAVDQQATASDSAKHAVQALFNSTSSAQYIDGTNTATGASIGTAGIQQTMIIGSTANATCASGVHLFTGTVFEIGVWGSDKSANNSSMNSNQHTYWGF